MTATDNAALWESVYAAFPYPRDQVESEINRIAAKCLKRALGRTGPVAIDPSTCEVHAAVIDAAELPGLIRYHDRVNLTGRTTPIVILRTQGKDIVIEGNNRVNKWVAEGDTAPRQAFVIVLQDGSSTA